MYVSFLISREISEVVVNVTQIFILKRGDGTKLLFIYVKVTKWHDDYEEKQVLKK